MELEILFSLIKGHKWEEFYKELKSEKYEELNFKDDQENYLLTYAVMYNNIEACELLLKYGAKIDIIDEEYRSILHIPIKFKYEKMCKFLLANDKEQIGISIVDLRDKNKNVALHYCMIYNNFEALKILLEHGSNLNAQDNQGYNILHLGIYLFQKKNIDMIKQILMYNIEIDAKCGTGETALHIACNLQLYEVVKILITHGAKVDIQDNDHEFTALHYSINLNNHDITKLLLEKGADPNIQDLSGNSSLHYACSDNNYEMMDLLMNGKNKLNYNVWNIYGKIPLHNMLQQNTGDHNSTIEKIIENSNLNIQNNNGNTCFHLLCKYKTWYDYVNILKEKRLDIFAVNKDLKRPIDYVSKQDHDKFIDMVTDSYIFKLRTKDATWTYEWQNMCKKELFISKMSSEDKSKLKSVLELKKMDTENDVCSSIVKTQLKKMINSNEQQICSKSFPSQQGNICIKISEGTVLPTCTFTGSTIDVIIGLLYLLKKYPDACSTFPPTFKENDDLCRFYKSMGIVVNSRCEFLNFEIVWVHQNLYLSNDFFHNYKKCLNNEAKRFIIIPIGIELKNGSHANYLIYDKQNNELERFEPHGSHAPYGFNYNSAMLDSVLESRFSEYSKMTYITPSSYSPKIGFQLFDISEKNKKRIGDPGGFCAVWAIWYVDNRLAYREIERKYLVEQMMNSIRAQNLSFKNVIRNYAKGIIELRDEILRKADIDINDWLYDNVSEQSSKIVINELTREIEMLSN
jgi:ankyrin repeat protein